MIEKLRNTPIYGCSADGETFGTVGIAPPTREELMEKLNEVINWANELEERLNKLEKKGGTQ